MLIPAVPWPLAMAPPVTVHKYVLPAFEPELYEVDELAQTVFGPTITGVGFAFLVTLNKVLDTLQPVTFTESLTTSVPTPAVPQVTVTLVVPWPAAMLPPVTVQK